MKKYMIKMLLGGLLIIGCIYNLTAQAGLSVVDIQDAVGSANTSPAAPLFYCYDDDMGSAWGFTGGYVEAWAEFTLGKDALIDGIGISSSHSLDTFITVEFYQKGKWIAFSGASRYLPGPGSGFLDLSYDNAVTKKIKFTISSVSLDDCLFFDIKIFGRNRETVFHRIKVQNILSEGIVSWNYPVTNLADNNPFTMWKLLPSYGGIKGSNSSMDKFRHDFYNRWNGSGALSADDADDGFEEEWEKFKDEENRCHNHKYNGAAVLELGNPYSIKTIMIHFTEEMESTLNIYVWKDSQWQEVDQIETTGLSGWYRKVCNPVLEGVWKVKIGISGIYQMNGGIGEVGIWGYGEYQGDEYNPVTLPAEACLSETFTAGFEHDIHSDQTCRIEIETDTVTEELKIEFNGIEYTGNSRLLTGEHALFGFDIPYDCYWEGKNFIKVIADGSSSNVYSIRIHGKRDYGSLPVITGRQGDDVLFTGIPLDESIEWEFPSEVYIQQVEVYGGENDRYDVWIRNKGEWYHLYIKEDQASICVYEGWIHGDALRIIPEGNTMVGEIRVLGSHTLDKIPEVYIQVGKDYKELPFPAGNPVFVTGFVDNPEALVTVNGFPVEQCGHYFWVKISGKDIVVEEDGYFTITAHATDAKGRTGIHTIRVVIEDSTKIWVNLPEDIFYTNRESVIITGTVHPWKQRVVSIDDEEVANGKPRFYHEKKLEEGLNLIKIQVRNIFNDRIVKTIYRRVVRIQEDIHLEISSPEPNSYIRSETVIVSGSVFSLSNVWVYVNGKPALVENGGFISPPIWLREGANTIAVSAMDGFNHRIKETIVVYRDTVGPHLTLTHPYDGYISATSRVLFTGEIEDSGNVWVYVNDAAAEIKNGMYSLSREFGDGYRNIQVKAVDTAGNVSGIIELTIIVDTQPPEAFEIHSNAETWVNNPQPVITFFTTDAASGIDHYELSIDSGVFTVVTSPYQCLLLGEGEHTVIVNAFDHAGWKRTSQARLYIDTIAPGAVLDFRTIPGNGRMILKWTRPDEDVIEYRIYRDESWEEGDMTVAAGLEAMEYTDEGLANGMSCNYRIIAIDKAYNTGESSPWIKGMTGFEKEPYSPEKGALVEYENVTILVKKESLPENVKEIRVTEITSEELEKLAWYPVISPIYDFSVLVEQDGEDKEQDHLEFEEEYVGFIKYDEARIPGDFPEENLNVYYYDPMWSRWFKVEKSGIDKEKNLIIFACNHFSEFSVQPTMLEDISPQQISEIGYNPFKTVSIHNGVTVSPQGGSAMTGMTELVLPGKNGFNFVLKRNYDTATAQGDGFGLGIFVSIGFGISDIVSGTILAEFANLGAQVLSSLANGLISMFDKVIYNNGDYAYSMGMGWRLNLPYIRGNNSTILVRLPDGSFHSLNKMKVMEGFNVIGAFRRYTFECHENADFRLEVTQARSNVDVAGIVQGSFSIPGWALVDAKLIMNDGTTYTFKANGSVEEITDPSGLNKIKVYYNGNKLDYILDSMGRKIFFEYDHGFMIPRIKKIWVEDPTGPDREINYTIVSGISDDLKIFLPLLKKAVDAGGREYHYEYDNHLLFTFGGSIKINFLSLFLDIITLGGWSALGFDDVTLSAHIQTDWVFVIRKASGPGIGITEIDYKRQALTSTTTEACDYLFGLFPTGIEMSFNVSERLSAETLRVRSREDSTLMKITTYQYDFKYKGDHQFVCEKTIESDGRTITTYYYDIIKRGRRRWVDYWDAVYEMVGNITNFNPNNIFTENPIITEVIPINTHITVEDIQHNILDNQVLEWDTGNAMRTYTYEIPYGLSGSGTHTGTMSFPVTRIKSQSNIRSETNKVVTEYTYDLWSNPQYTREYSVNGDRINLKEEWVYYLSADSSPADIFSAYPSPYTEPLLSRYMKNLPSGHIVRNTPPLESGITEPVYVISYNEYNNLGQMTASSNWTGTGWVETSYTYNPDHGTVENITNPMGHVKTIVYDYNFARHPGTYYITTTEKDVVDADGNSRDIVAVNGYDFATGNLIWSRNPRGFVTEYEYDNLGRVIKLTEPDDDPGETGWDPRNSTRPEPENNPVTAIEYNDRELWSRVTNANNSKVFSDYNDLGKLIRLEKENNGISSYSVTRVGYDPWGNITSITDPNNNTTNYEYDAKNKLSGIIHPVENGERTERKMIYNYSSNTLITIDENKNVTEEIFDMQERLIKQVKYNGTEKMETLSYYDSLGNNVVSIDPLGHKTVNVYDERNLLTKTILPEDGFYENGIPVTVSPYIRYEYDDAGFKTGEIRGIAGGEHRTVSGNDGLGRPYRTRIPYTDVNGEEREAVQEVFYDESGNTIRTIDAVNTALKYAGINYYSNDALYSAKEKVLKQGKAVYRSATDGTVIDEGESTIFTYDKLGNVQTMTDPRGTNGMYDGDFTLVYHYDSLNRLVKGELPASRDESTKRSVEFVYDPRGNVIVHKVPDGGKTINTYTPRNWVKTETMTGGGSSVSYTTTHEYDDGGNEILTRDNAGNETVKYYDNLNRLTRVEYPEGDVERIRYDKLGNTIETIDGENHSTYFEYNAYNKAILLTDAAGSRFYSYYDRWGNKTKDTDAENNINTYVYDELNRLLEEANSLGFHYSYRYDAVGNIIQSRDANGTTGVYTYTPEYLINSITYANGEKIHSISYEYDEAGFMKKAMDDGVVTEFNIVDGVYQPDPYDKVYTHVTSTGSRIFGLSYSYDVMDRVTGITYPTAQTVHYSYNNLGQLTGVPGYIEEEPAYNNRGLLEKITAFNGTTGEYAYDKNARIANLEYKDRNLEEIQAYALTYDKAGNIIRKNFSMYNYDRLNRLGYAELNGKFRVDNPDEEQVAGLAEKDFTGEEAIDFTISEDQVIKLDYNARSIGIDLGKIRYVSRMELYPADPDYRLRARSVKVFVSEVNADGSFREAAGTVMVQHEDGVIELKLKQAEKAQYVKIHCNFDDRDIQNNVLDKATFYNSAINIARVYYMLEWRRERYSYDDVGNRLSSIISLLETTNTEYTYYPNTGGGNSPRLWKDSAYEYVYDNNGNLIQKMETATGVSWEYEFNLLNRLVAVRKKDPAGGEARLIASYLYNEAGYRIKKQSEEKGTTWFTFSTAGAVLYEEKDTGNYREYVYVLGRHFARVEGDESGRKKYFYHTDNLGSTTAITDEAGEVVWRNDYTPFGSETGEIGIGEHDVKFTGKDFDGETGLYYFNARWYDAESGRFISQDPVKDGVNWYVYCGNRPMTFVDKSGLNDENNNTGTDSISLLLPPFPLPPFPPINIENPSPIISMSEGRMETTPKLIQGTPPTSFDFLKFATDMFGNHLPFEDVLSQNLAGAGFTWTPEGEYTYKLLPNNNTQLTFDDASINYSLLGPLGIPDMTFSAYFSKGSTIGTSLVYSFKEIGATFSASYSFNGNPDTALAGIHPTYSAGFSIQSKIEEQKFLNFAISASTTNGQWGINAEVGGYHQGLYLSMIAAIDSNRTVSNAVGIGLYTKDFQGSIKFGYEARDGGIKPIFSGGITFPLLQVPWGEGLSIGSVRKPPE